MEAQIPTCGTRPRFSWKPPSGWGVLPPPYSLPLLLLKQGCQQGLLHWGSYTLWPANLYSGLQRAGVEPPIAYLPLGNSLLPKPSKLSQLLLACHMLKKTHERRHCILFRPQ